MGSIGDSGDTLSKLSELGLICDWPSFTQFGENDGGEFSAVPHGNVGEDDEDDHPNDGSNSEDSDRSSGEDFFDVSLSSLPLRPGGVKTAVLVLTSATDIPTLSVRGSPPAFTPCCIESGCGLQLTVMSTIRGEAETVLIIFPGLHFPVTKSTVGAESSCLLRGRSGCPL